MSFLGQIFGRKEGQKQSQESRATPPPPVRSKAALHPEIEFAYVPGDLIADRYEVVDILAGGMGVVFLCLDCEKNHPVALKTFKPEYLPDRAARDRFLREGAIWVDLGRHPHIVRCYQVLAPDIGPEVYLVLEWVAQAEGKRDASMRAWLKPGSRWPAGQALVCALHIARGMKYATTRIPGLVHRDLKPENILMGRDGLARVTDFGVATTLAELDMSNLEAHRMEAVFNRTQLTHGGVVGTPFYMAPEQWTPGEKLDARTDIYAFGCILYEMVTGRKAVTGYSLGELEEAHRTGQARERIHGIQPDVAELLQHCLVPEPHNRCRSWNEVEAQVVRTYHYLTGKDVPSEILGEGETRAERMAAGWSYEALGVSYLKIGKYKTAARFFERVAEIGESEGNRWLEAVGLCHLGPSYSQLGDARQAIKFSEQALTIAQEIGWSEDGTILGHLGNAHRDLGDMQQALEYYEKALASVRKAGNQLGEKAILNSLGNLYRRLGNLHQAIGYYEQSLTTSQEVVDRAGEGLVLGNLGICYRNLGDAQRAVEFLGQALSIAQEMGNRAEEGRALSNLGNAYGDLGDLQGAFGFAEQGLAIAREIGNKRSEAIGLGNLGNAYLDLGHIGKAENAYRQAVFISQEIGDVMGVALNSLNLAKLLATRKWSMLTEARQHAKLASQMYASVGRAELAHRANEFIGEIDIQMRANSHWDRGVELANQGLVEKAINEYKAGLQLNPNHAMIRYNLGAAYCQQGRFDEAIRELEPVVRVYPQLTAAHKSLGGAYASLGRFDEAVKAFEVALRLEPHSDETRHLVCSAQCDLGLDYLRQGRVVDAAREFQAVLHADPSHVDAHLNLGGVYAQQGHLDKAIREYQAVLHIDPSDARANYNLGLAYQQQGHRDKAIRELQLAAQLGFEPAWNSLALMGQL